MDEYVHYYAEIPLKQARKTKAIGHDSFKQAALSGSISVSFTALQSIHVGSGVLVAPNDIQCVSTMPLVKAFFRANKRRVIPASSIKGMLRSLVEMFTSSCTCTQHGCSDRQKDFLLCTACRIFGALGFRGNVSIGDGRFYKPTEFAVVEIPPQYSYKKPEGGRRYYPHRLIDPRKPTWPVEAAGVGSVFKTEIEFTNLTKGEVGILLIALGQGDWKICPKIGSGKSAGLGAVKITNLNGTTYDSAQCYVNYDIAFLPLDIAGCLAEAKTLIDESSLAKLARDLSEESIHPRGK